MKKAEQDFKKKRKKTFEEIFKSRKKARKSKMVVVSNEDDIDDIFTWEEYLEKCSAKAVSQCAFKHVPVFESKSPGFKPGMKVEAKDRSSTCNSYWVATVVMASGPLLLLRFDGYDNDRKGDFWLNISSQLLQPIGWCAKTDNLLIPPEAIRHKEQNWAKYLINNLKDAIAAPDEFFHKSGDDKNLKIGAKLEVQDSENPLCYWIATVVEVFGLRLHLRFEGYEAEDNDIWVCLLSDQVHNLGWNKQMHMMLKPPKVMEKYFRWSIFRKVVELCLNQSGKDQSNETQEACLPINKGFIQGMKLEAVDPKNPLFICIATVKDILTHHFFTVEIDSAMVQSNSPATPKFVCHSKSKYIFPIGWCEKNNVKLTPPKGYSANSFQCKPYLHSMKAEAAPDSLFDKDLVKQKPINLSDLNQIKLGSYKEILDQDDPSSYWVGKVIKNDGFKLYVHLEGDIHKDNIIQVYYLSESVHHLGWGSQAGLELRPPRAMKSLWLDERELLDELYKLRNTTPLKLKKDDGLPHIHEYKAGMQLEAVNPHDPSSICVASVKKNINKYYFTVQIDSVIHTTNDKNIVFWCHGKSKNIFPAGWCDKNNLQLTPPPGYSNKEFKWDTYMESLHTKAAPESLFCQDVPSCAFDIDLKLEAVDQTKPETISVATVTQVVGRTIWVRLDGYPSNAIEHIYDMDSSDMLPAGWCSTYGHPLLTPHQKKKEPQTSRWVASLRKRSTDSRVSKAADSSMKRKAKSLSSSKAKKLRKNGERMEHKHHVDLHKANPKETQQITSTKAASLQTPSSSTADESSRPSEEIIDVDDTDTASESGNEPTFTTTIDLTEDNNEPPDVADNIRLFVKKSCSCGPYIDRKKAALIPEVIGPDEPNTILRKIVEHLVRCSYSTNKVLQLLASEKEKKSFFSILKTLVSKLSICENLFSLHLVKKCASCDKVAIQEVAVSQGKSPTPSSTTTTTLPNNNTNQNTTKILKSKPPSPITTTTNTNSDTNHNTTKILKSKLQPIKETPASIKSPTTNANQSSNTPLDNNDDEEVIGKIPVGHISKWSIAEVVEFVSPRDCKKFADVFLEQEVDGKALMLLSLDDIHKVLGVTLGPALKLHDDVQKLRRR